MATALRIVLFALAGAALAAMIAGAYQWWMLVDAGHEPSRIALRALLIDVMDVPYYALCGAITAALGATYSAARLTAFGCMLYWLVLGACSAIAITVGAFGLRVGRLPQASELWPLPGLGMQFLLIALITGAALGLLQLAMRASRAWLAMRRARRAAQAREFADFDAVAGVEMRRRAEEYLAERHAGRADATLSLDEPDADKR